MYACLTYLYITFTMPEQHVCLQQSVLIFVVSFQCSDKLGLSLELGSFAAGVMISTTDLGQHTLEQVRNNSRVCSL